MDKIVKQMLQNADNIPVLKRKYKQMFVNTI